MQNDVERTVQKARELLDDRILSIETLKKARDREVGLLAFYKEAQQETARAWAAARDKGWSEAELKRLGLPKPDARLPGRPRGRKTTPRAARNSSTDVPQQPSGKSTAEPVAEEASMSAPLSVVNEVPPPNQTP